MDNQNSIEVRNVSKAFRVYHEEKKSLIDKLMFFRHRYEERQVLKNISFDVKKGEAVGLVGHNGCGKSTTLKLLTRIMYPDAGAIRMQGRVSSLIELGAGFHPDMSGRQNIYTNASIFGLTRKEIDERLEQIIAFSELEAYIDNPVRTYSSGMYMRLAFAVAINVDADILLVDEILAVGDAAFQEKCFRKLREIKSGGTTIVIVSHSMAQIEKICDRCIWIHEGEIRADGEPTDVNAAYMEHMRVRTMEMNRKQEQGTADREAAALLKEQIDMECIPGSGIRTGNHRGTITSIRLLDDEEKETKIFHTGGKAVIELVIDVQEPLKNAAIRWNFYRDDLVQCFATNTRNDGIELSLEHQTTVRFEIDQLELLPGEYIADLRLVEGEDDTNVDFISKAIRFVVGHNGKEAGMVNIKHKWIVGA